MSDKHAPTTSRRSLAEVLASIESATDPEKALLELTIERARAKHPELAAAIRFCAIPRRLDVEVIGVLRDAPNDAEVNNYLFTELLKHSFVLQRRDGGYVYHDNVRDQLLAEWREPAHREEFNGYNRRLVSFFESRHDEVKEDEERWREVAGIVRRANQSRHTRIASQMESQLVEPLLEALYHETLRSAADGYEFFGRQCFAYESCRRLTICESLLNALTGYIELLPADERSFPRKNWLSYWRARIARQLGRAAEAEMINRELLGQIRDDTMLELWTLDELGVCLQNQENFNEARITFERLLARALETRHDPYNLPLNYSRIAGLHWLLDEPAEAAGNYRRSVRAAREVENRGQEASSLLDLSGVLQSLGEWDQAIGTALDACHLIRRETPADRAAHQLLLTRLRGLVARRDPRLLETLLLESQLGVPLTGDESQSLTELHDHIETLRMSGQFKRAEQSLNEFQTRSAESPDPNSYSGFLIVRALMHEDQGRMAEAGRDYDEVIERARKDQASAWQRAVAGHNRGLCSMEQGLAAEARAGLERAGSEWEAMGRWKLMAYAKVSVAEGLRREGRLAEARRMLDEAREGLAGGNPSYLATLHRIQAHVHRDRAQWAAAREEYLQAAALRRSLDEYSGAAQDLGWLAMLVSHEGKWDEAARYTAEAHELWRLLAEINAYDPPESAKIADLHNARGVRELAVEATDRGEALQHAREHFQQAIEIASDNFWYYLNLADACEGLEEWTGAAAAIEQAIERSPKWGRLSALGGRLAEYYLNHGESLAGRNETKAAVEAYTRSQSWLEQAQLSGRGQFNRLAENWMKLGDGLLQLDHWEEARTKYQIGLTQAVAAEDAAIQSALYARFGFIAAIHGNATSARQHFWQYVSVQPVGKRDGAAQSFVNECSRLIRTPEQNRRLTAMLRDFADDPVMDAPLRKHLIAARFDLILSSQYAVAPASEKLLFVDPIAVEAEESVFPQGDDWWQAHPLFKQYIPGTRDRLEGVMGVRIPLVRVRSNNTTLPAGAYIFLLHETPVLMGTLYPGSRFCPDQEAVRTLKDEAEADECRMGFNPLTGRFDGAWVNERGQQRLAAATLWEPLEYLTRHLESFLRPRLDALFGLQEMSNLLDNWRQQGDGDEQQRREKLVQSTLPDLRARLKLFQVLQSLLREQTPIVEIGMILEAIRQPALASRDIIPVVEAVRLALRDHLPGNDSSYEFLRLSVEFEAEMKQWIHERGGKTFFAIPPEETQSLLSATRDAVGEHDQNALAIIVGDESLRPFVRRLIELEFPAVHVLSQREQRPELREKTSGVIEYEP